MSILKALVCEHQIFRDLSGHIKSCAMRFGKNAETDLRGALAVLLPALRRHEEIESMIFGASGRGTKLEHHRIEIISAKLIRTIKVTQRLRMKEVRPLILELTDQLRLHLENEERRVWPERILETLNMHADHARASRGIPQVQLAAAC